jgi:hypothetical protein
MDATLAGSFPGKFCGKSLPLVVAVIDDQHKPCSSSSSSSSSVAAYLLHV